MPRFSTHGQAQLRDLKGQLASLRTDAPPVLDSWLSQLSELLGLGKGLIYSVRHEGESLALDHMVMARMSPPAKRNLFDEFDRVMRRTRRRWSVFDPARPEPGQRNRVMSFWPEELFAQVSERTARLEQSGGPGVEEAQTTRAGLAQLIDMLPRVDLANRWQLRALICKDDSLLAWVGGMRAERPTKREERLLANLVPDLRRRLALDQLLGRAPMLEATLDIVLEQIPRAAFIASKSGTVLLMNSPARDELERSPQQTRTALSEALANPSRTHLFAITPIASTGRAPVYLLVGRQRAGIHERLTAIAIRWELTPRQREVLALVVHGEANRIIANTLRCAERTVELHLTALFAKACVESRAALISRFFLGD